MRVRFYGDPDRGPRSREEVRFNRLGIFVHPEGRLVSLGFDISPFLERPSIEVQVVSETGHEAATLSVIEAVEPAFSLTVHLRDKNPTATYQLLASLYYPTESDGPLVVDRLTKRIDTSVVGEQ